MNQVSKTSSKYIKVSYVWPKSAENLFVCGGYKKLYHFNYSNRTVQSAISFTKITYRTAKIFHEM